jgi:integrase
MDEVRRLLSAATGREHLTLRLLLVAGLRPAELFALKTDDMLGGGALRIDEAVKNAERQASGRRLGSTKTAESNGLVSISIDLETELRVWAAMRPAGALLFPTERGTTWRLGNYLKRFLKPLAVSVGIEDLTFQCLRRTCATHFAGDVKTRQTHMRHADPATTLRHYQKAIPESQRIAVEELDAEFRVQPEKADKAGTVQ